MSDRERDVVCLACGRRGRWPVEWVRPNGNQHQAVGFCRDRCRRAYNGEPARPERPQGRAEDGPRA